MQTLLLFNPVANKPDNWIPEEEHTVSPQTGESFRFFKPHYGPFFNKDLKVYHVKASGEKMELIPGLHYALGHKYLKGSRHILQPLYVTVQIIDRNLAGKFLVSYHSLGDEPTDIINQLVIEGAHALLEPKKYLIEDIIGMPEFLPPVDHDVLTDEVFGWNKNVEAIWALVHALAGDPTIPHTHSIEDIPELLELLSGKASVDNSHKAGIHQAQRVVNHTGTVSLTLPTFNGRGAITGNLVLFWKNRFIPVSFQGECHAAAEVNVPNLSWLSGEVHAKEELPFNKVAFTYDGSKRPVIYFGNNVLFDDVTFVLCDVTYNLDYTADKRTGYTFTKESVFRGAARDVVRLDLLEAERINDAMNTKVDKTAKINKRPIGDGVNLWEGDLLVSGFSSKFDGDGNITEYTIKGMVHVVSYHDSLISEINSAREKQIFNYNDNRELISITVEQK